MIGTFLVAFALVQGPATQAAPAVPGETAVQIIQKVLAHYSEAKSISGVISLTQTAGGAAVKIDTQLQFDRPAKIYLRQDKGGSEPRRYQLLSNGATFSYDRPDGVLGKPRFVEYVTQNNHSQTIKDMYSVERFLLADPNAMLDIAISRTDDLRALMAQWPAMKVDGTASINGEDATKIIGNYIDKPGEKPTGNFEAYVTKDYDLVRFVLRQHLSVQIDDRPQNTIEIVSVWDSSLKVNKPTNPALYQSAG